MSRFVRRISGGYYVYDTKRKGKKITSKYIHKATKTDLLKHFYKKARRGLKLLRNI